MTFDILDREDETVGVLARWRDIGARGVFETLVNSGQSPWILILFC